MNTVHLVERTNTALQMWNAPEELTYEVIQVFTGDRAAERAAAYAHECRNLCKVRKVRVRTFNASQYGA